MKPIKFLGYDCIYAEHQPEYLPLPAHKSKDSEGTVTTCWKLTWRERWKIFMCGCLYLQTLTFNTPLQPLRPSVLNPLSEVIHV